MVEPSTRPEPAPIDFAQALTTLEGSLTLLIQLVPMVLEQIDIDLPVIRTHVMARNTDALRAASHRLKGSLGAIAAVPAYEACADLQKAARMADYDAYASVLCQLEREIGRLRPCLCTWLADKQNNSLERN